VLKADASLTLSMTYVASSVIVFSFSVGERKLMNHFVVSNFSSSLLLKKCLHLNIETHIRALRLLEAQNSERKPRFRSWQ
jgi:hypothetical protein